MRALIAVLMALCLLTLGCLGGGGQEGTAGQTVTQPSVEANQNVSLADADVPFIGENDTVEIGEMI
jgi:hypothetical protein